MFLSCQWAWTNMDNRMLSAGTSRVLPFSLHRKGQSSTTCLIFVTSYRFLLFMTNCCYRWTSEGENWSGSGVRVAWHIARSSAAAAICWCMPRTYSCTAQHNSPSLTGSQPLTHQCYCWCQEKTIWSVNEQVSIIHFINLIPYEKARNSSKHIPLDHTIPYHSSISPKPTIGPLLKNMGQLA